MMSSAEQPSEQDLQFIRDLVRMKSAIVLEENKNYLLTARLQPLARRNGMSSISELVRKLRNNHHGTLHNSVVEAMTTNETSFFRDVAPFDALRTKVVPELMERRRVTRTLKIWCAACSSGQEPYTVAMTCLDAFPELEDWNFSILATDLSQEMVDRTNHGMYTQLEVNRGLPASFLLRYFKKKGMKYVAQDGLRQLVTAETMNLIEPWRPLGVFDIVFIRNVLIYFSPDTKAQILERVRGVLRRDGFMFLGGAETTLGIHDAFERVPVPKASCYRMKD
jgi:chemotaxis protein methyltransferase CheR